MRKKILIGVLMIVVIFLLVGCNGRQRVTIDGYIRDHNSADPVEGATVTIGFRERTTNENGYFRFLNIPVSDPLEVVVRKEDSNYWPEKETVFVGSQTEETLPTVYLKDKDQFSGSVSGRVSFADSLLGNINADPSPKRDLTQADSDSSVQRVNTIPEDCPGYVEGEVLVTFKSELAASRLEQQDLRGQKTQLSASADGNNARTYLIKEEGTAAEELKDYYREQPLVESVNYNRIGYVMGSAGQVEPDDDRFDDQWYHWDMRTPYAWDITTGSSDVTVAVIDSGYVEHEDLEANIGWGYDTIFNDYNPMDLDSYYYGEDDYEYSHGTHMAGLIGAVGNNGIGIAGVNWDVNIMPVRIVDDGSFNEANLIQAINHAVDNGADIINISLAFNPEQGTKDSDFDGVKNALEDAYNQGVTVIAAAGNGSEKYSYYPASSQYTISVAASSHDANEIYAPYTNRGEDLLAPGGDLDYDEGGILSTNSYEGGPNDEYVFMEGTSCSTALVSGAAALLTAEGYQGKDTILKVLQDTKDEESGIINIFKALGGEDDEEDAPDPAPSFDNMRVMAAFKVDNTYHVVSDIDDNLWDNGSYDLDRVKVGEDLKIIAWIDMDNSGSISWGDYFGESETLSLNQGQQKGNIDFEVEEVYRRGDVQSRTEEQTGTVDKLPEISFEPPEK